MKKLFVLLSVIVLLGSCSNTKVVSLKGTLWANASYRYGLTNVAIYNFITDDECNLFTAGDTSIPANIKCKYTLKDNTVTIASIEGELRDTCIIKNNELLFNKSSNDLSKDGYSRRYHLLSD